MTASEGSKQALLLDVTLTVLDASKDYVAVIAAVFWLSAETIVLEMTTADYYI